MRKQISWVLLPLTFIFSLYLYFYLAAALAASSYYDALIAGEIGAVAKVYFPNNLTVRKNFINKLNRAFSWDNSSYLSYKIKSITFLEKGFNYPEVVVKIRKKDLAGVREYEERIALVKKGIGYQVNGITFSQDPIAKYRDQQPGEELNEAEKKVLELNLLPENIVEVEVTDKYNHKIKFIPDVNDKEIKLLLKGLREGTLQSLNPVANYNYKILVKVREEKAKEKEIGLEYSTDFNVLKVSGKFFKASPAIKILLGNLSA